MDVNIDELVLQEEEVSDVKWASLEEVLTLLKENKFVDYDENLIKFYFSWIKNI